ncbi:uncharacterized protein PAC_04388 [Phialocephala subalpina]|uniref:FAD-binding domain-containing protein n=1 Tax=Phialocephala subalpina TaxID=576137 RepID=A0A1L7WP02_9HELO|nr:uncharacterized protein PAC_04388 [Phialocephala subalpina]
MRLHRGDTGEVIRTRDQDDYMELYGYPFWQVLREAYVPVMMEVVKKYGVNLRLICRVKDIDQKATAVILDTGERIEADLIVGADGIRTIVRRSAVPGGDVPMDTYWNAYICRIPKEPILQDPELAFIMNEHALWMSANMDQVLNLITYCKRWKVVEPPELATWSNEKGKCVLIGDAAHAMIPAAAQGAGMGIEDGPAIAECLDRARNLSDIPRLLKAFETIRKPRTTRVKHQARANAEIFMVADPEAQRKRDHEWKSDPSNRTGYNLDKDKAEELKQGSLAKQNWLLGYDVYEVVSVIPPLRNKFCLANAVRRTKNWTEYWEFRVHEKGWHGNARAGSSYMNVLAMLVHMKRFMACVMREVLRY